MTLAIDSETPITDALIAKVMEENPGETPRALAKYFEEVHQELAPLCRKFEVENRFLRQQLALKRKETGGTEPMDKKGSGHVR